MCVIWSYDSRWQYLSSVELGAEKATSNDMCQWWPNRLKAVYSAAKQPDNFKSERMTTPIKHH